MLLIVRPSLVETLPFGLRGCCFPRDFSQRAPSESEVESDEEEGATTAHDEDGEHAHDPHYRPQPQEARDEENGDADDDDSGGREVQQDQANAGAHRSAAPPPRRRVRLASVAAVVAEA